MDAAYFDEADTCVRKNFADVLGEKKITHLLFTWTIENFLLMPEDDHKFLVSPTFQVDSVTSSWYLTFNPYYPLKDSKCFRFVLFRRKLDDACSFATVTYRIGVKISGVTQWGEEKRGLLMKPNDHSSLVMNIRDFCNSAGDFCQHTIEIMCEMYLSQQVSEDTIEKKALSSETIDLLRLSYDISKLTAEVSDVIIRVGGSEFPCHKSILSARSPVFARMLQDKRACLILKEEDSDHIYNILTYIYSGYLPYVTQKRIFCIGLYECAERYSVNGLKELLHPVKISGLTSISVEEIDFTWKIERFSTLSQRENEFVLSPIFGNGDRNLSPWYLQLYPNGRLKTPNNVGIFLNTATLREILHVKVQISIVNEDMDELFKECIDKVWVPHYVYGFPKFIEKSKLEKYLKNDELILNCKIKLRIPTSLLRKTSAICYFYTAEHVGLNSLSKDFEKLIYNRALSDVTVVLGDGLFYFHRQILIARSPVFEQHLKVCGDNECVIGVTDVSGNIFEEFIYYIYTGKLRKISTTEAVKLYEVAKKYEVQCLANRCLKFLIFFLDVDGFKDVFIFADKHEDEFLMSKCSRFFQQNREKILQSIDWKKFSITKSEFLSKLSPQLS